MKIPVFLGSVRTGRKSDVVARYVISRLQQMPGVETSLLDLLELNLPIMEERVKMSPNAPEGARRLSLELSAADAVVIVAPEYNWSMSGALKNAIDYLGDELRRKPVGLVTVTTGALGGMQLATQFRGIAASMGAYVVPQLFPVTKVAETFGPDATPLDPMVDKRADTFINELLFMTKAVTAAKAGL